MGTKKKIRRKIYNYFAVFDPAEEDGYVAHVPRLPGWYTHGETFMEAQRNIKKAMKAYLLAL